MIDKSEKATELIKYRDLLLATLDYHIENNKIKIITADFDSTKHYESLKIQTVENFEKGKLAKLKQWFRDLTEMQIETLDFKFNKYLQDKTKYQIDIFESFFQRVDKIIEKGKITTDNQFYDITIMIDQLCQSEPQDKEKMEKLDKLLMNYRKK